jgi:large subunit ribosomal protein L19
MNIVQKIHNENLKTDIPEYRVGDTIRVDVLIVEGGKERVQAFTGTVIGDSGEGVARTVTVRRFSYGQGVERVFPLNSPRVQGIEVVRHGKTSRGKLYYLRDQVGRAARVKERRVR